MYIHDRSSEGSPARAVEGPRLLGGLGLNVERAIRLNRTYAARLGWGKQVGRIAPLLGAPGAASDSEELVRALIPWQQGRGLAADGILGPKTWEAIRSSLDRASPPPPPPPLPAGAFVPTPVEVPGGGRIVDKTAPPRSEIVTVEGIRGRKIPLHRVAADAWRALVAAARRASIRSPHLLPVSGFRDPVRQARLWKRALKKYGSPRVARKWVAPPGGSAHQSGRAIDFYLGGKNSSGNVARLRKTAAYRWLKENAHRFGFYPYEREPWHWEYNPPSVRPGPSPAPSNACTRVTEGPITYRVESGKEFGTVWARKGTRPPGLPVTARCASRPNDALPHVERIARATGLGEVFVRIMKQMALTESGGRFGLPANNFDARPGHLRPPGKGLITAWGAFQFNRDAWRSLPGVPATAYPWNSSPSEELTLPIRRYADTYRKALAVRGATAVDGVGLIRLRHISSKFYRWWLTNARRIGPGAAWRGLNRSYQQWHAQRKTKPREPDLVGRIQAFLGKAKIQARLAR